MPARTNPDGKSPSGFDPFSETRVVQATTLPSRGTMSHSLYNSSSFLAETDTFSNDPFFAKPPSHKPTSGRTSAPPLSTPFSKGSGGSSFADPFFSQSSNGFNDDPFTKVPATSTSSLNNGEDPFKSVSSNNGFSGDPFSFSTNNQSNTTSNKFGDDSFNSVFGSSVFDAKTSKFGTETTKLDSSSNSIKPLTGSAAKTNGSQALPSEDEQLAWAALESLKLETEQKLKDSQEKADLEMALKLSQQGGDSFPVKW